MWCSIVVITLCFSAAIADQGTRLAERQSLSQCSAITTNIDSVRELCRVDTTTCLLSETKGFGDIPVIQNLICPPTQGNRDNIYGALILCESQTYADQVYSGLCGNITDSEGKTTDTFCTDAILRYNNGTAAKQACCSDNKTEDGSGSSCASELTRLASDLRCCTATIVLQFFFEDCGEYNGTESIDGLLQKYNVAQPDLCPFPLYEGTGKGLTLSPSLSVLTFLAVTGWLLARYSA